ncbi:hypothetical protein [Clostridium chrysemydis]|uniref:hypothetical protein n=1 Tax=Clostridium chrysemydis TaxID=2665504 RepID=UPI003F4061CD
MKKIASIMVTVVLLISFIPVSNVSAEELIKSEEGVKLYLATECSDDVGKCDCDVSYSDHNNNLKKEVAIKGIEEKALLCDCGGSLISRVVHTGKWNYPSSRKCTHNLRGNDYIYTRRVITAYDCNRCSFYGEIDSEQSKVECKGV